MTDEPTVPCEVQDKVCTITMNRPRVLNATGRAMQAGSVGAFGRAESYPAASVILLRGAGRCRRFRPWPNAMTAFSRIVGRG
jgi:enoyl-CoA hydratase